MTYPDWDLDDIAEARRRAGYSDAEIQRDVYERPPVIGQPVDLPLETSKTDRVMAGSRVHGRHDGAEATPRRKQRGHPEADFQQQIIELLHLNGWVVAHFRSARTGKGWVTPVAADGAGFLDLLAVHARPGRVLAIEVKTDSGRLTPEQQAWRDNWDSAGFPAFVARPSNWEQLVKIVKGEIVQ